jgi:hypothetical protein
VEGQKEMLLPIAGQREAAKAAAKESPKEPARKPARAGGKQRKAG